MSVSALMSRRVYDCPNCGASVPFESAIAVFAVCAFCRSMVVRDDAGVRGLGEMAALPPDLSPLQIGSTGIWQGASFRIAGRVRMEWEAGSWNEWFCAFDTGEDGWLADAQGFYTMSRLAKAVPAAELQPGSLKYGEPFEFQDIQWMVADVKTSKCIAAEGSLPYTVPPGTTRIGADLIGPRGAFAAVESGDWETAIYVGAHTSLKELSMGNLRPVPGWDADVATIKYQTTGLNCPSCGAPVQLRAAGLTMSAVCGSCGTLLDTANPHLQIIQETNTAVQAMQLALEIGRRGRLGETEFEIIGAAERFDGYGKWQEYLLFNPWEGYRWLVTYGGHWTLVDRRPDLSYAASLTRIDMNGRTYKVFARGEAEVRGVLGEFYWKISRGEKNSIADFVAPPFILSCETDYERNEQSWSHGQYLPHRVVSEAFGVPDLRKPEGVYLNQPNELQDRWVTLKRWAMAAMILIFAVQVWTCDSKTIPKLKTSGTYAKTDAARIWTSPTFELSANRPIQLDAYAKVTNAWISLDIDLVNAATNATTDAGIEISYYEGNNDGPWHEGTRNPSLLLNAVPGGKYFLNIKAEADSTLDQVPFEVSVSSGGYFVSNFVIALLLVALYPIGVWVRAKNFEALRWAQSDFSG